MPTKSEFEAYLNQIERDIRKVLPSARITGGELGAKTLMLQVEIPRPWPISAGAAARQDNDPLVIPIGVDVEKPIGIYVNLRRYPLVVISPRNSAAWDLVLALREALEAKGMRVGTMSMRGIIDPPDADVLMGRLEAYAMHGSNRPFIAVTDPLSDHFTTRHIGGNIIALSHVAEDKWDMWTPEGMWRVVAVTASDAPAPVQVATIGEDVR